MVHCDALSKVHTARVHTDLLRRWGMSLHDGGDGTCPQHGPLHGTWLQVALGLKEHRYGHSGPLLRRWVPLGCL